jgi:hypothetical protein
MPLARESTHVCGSEFVNRTRAARCRGSPRFSGGVRTGLEGKSRLARFVDSVPEHSALVRRCKPPSRVRGPVFEQLRSVTLLAVNVEPRKRKRRYLIPVMDEDDACC